MKKLILGGLVAGALVAPIAATAGQASATTSCTPSAAVPAVTHTQYKYMPLFGKSPHWSNKDAGRTLIYDWTLYYRATGSGSTRDFVDVPAKNAVTCPVPPAVEATTYEVKFSESSGTHVDLPDVFDIDETASGWAGYWSTKFKVKVTNNTNTDQEFHVRYADQQDGNRVWVAGSRFTDGLPNNIVPANSSRPFEIDVWYDALVTSGADVPDDLTLDFGFELAPAIPALTEVTLPTSFEGEGTYTVVVPFTKGVDTFIIGARGYDEHTPITKDSVVTKADADQFWVGHKAQPGYVIANPAVGNNDRTLAQWHIDFTFANPTSATGDVTWKYGEVTGTINVNAHVANGGSFDYTDSTGQTLHGVVTPGTLMKDGSKVIFTGTITDSNVEWNIDRPFTGVVIDGDVDQIGVFVDRDVDGILADVTGGNLTVH